MPATAESNLLNINLDEIIETERILLPVGKSFDAERRRFIKNFVQYTDNEEGQNLVKSGPQV